MNKEELPSRLRDFSNGMHGLAHDAAYIIHELEEVKAERDELQEKLSENLAGEKLVLGLKAMGLSGEVQEWLGVFQLLAATGISKDALRKVARGYSAGNLKLADAPQQEPEPEKPGYQDFYDSIGAKDLLFRAEDSPKRLTVEELDAAEVGSVLLHPNETWRKAVKVERSGGSAEFNWKQGAGYNTAGFLLERGWDTATLSPPAPRELPTKAGPVVLVTEFDGLYATSPEPIYAYMHEGDWYRIDGKDWPGDYGYKAARAEQITGWKTARIVEDGEA